MAPILTAAEMRALERTAIDKGEVTDVELMERAGRGVVEAILAEWPDIEKGARRAVVLCGPGNNGGDGFVVARLLKDREWDVVVWSLGDVDRMPQEAATNARRWIQSYPANSLPAVLERGSDHDISASVLSDPLPCCVVVDALFGTGLTRPLESSSTHLDTLLLSLSSLRETISDFGMGHPQVDLKWVAVDVPSGLCSDSGRLLTEASDPDQAQDLRGIVADLTVTFHSRKAGHLVGDGPSVCGKLVVVDIGLDARLGWKSDGIEEAWPRKIAKRSGHKYGYGHAVVLGGRPGKGGAARMAARGALRIGAGLVTLAVPPAALQENAAALDAVMLRSVKNPDALADYLEDDRLNALGAGPGLGTGEREAALVATLLDLRRPTILDADALTLISKDDALRAKLHDKVVLTPHEGEFTRLFSDISARWHAPATRGPAFSKVDATRDAARQAGCTVLLKGPDTVIADPSGRSAINAAVYDRAAPWLATAGSGDVLAGFICGLLARGLSAFDAACTAAWLHVECARSFGPGLIAEDLPEELPKVFRAMGL